MNRYFLYKITNTLDGKFYIGMTKNLERRWVVHCSPSSKCPKLRAAIQKHGKENFTKEVLCIGSKEYIADLEQQYILKTNSTELGYNIDVGGKYYRDNHKLNTKTNQPLYVSGWWFPNKDVAMKNLCLKEGSFYKWLKDNTLGDLQHFRGPKLGTGNKPVYVKRFWFPSLSKASEILCMSPTNVHRLSKQGDKTFDDCRVGSQKGCKSPSAMSVLVEGVEYPAIRTAAEVTGIPRSTIKRRIQNGIHGYRFNNKTEEP